MVESLMHEKTISALVINLDHCIERMRFQEKQLHALNIDFERLPAIAVTDIDPSFYEQHANDWERKLRPTEVACFLSHLNAWKKVAELQKPYLILEDDALLAVHCRKLLSDLAENPLRANIVTLEARGRKKLLDRSANEINDFFQAVRLYQDRTGAAGYVLFPSGAEKLLESFRKKGMALADAFIANNHQLISWQIEPAACIQLDMCRHYDISERMAVASTIATTVADKPKADSRKQYFCFKIRRLLMQLKVGRRFFSRIHAASRRSVLVNKDFFD